MAKRWNLVVLLMLLGAAVRLEAQDNRFSSPPAPRPLRSGLEQAATPVSSPNQDPAARDEEPIAQTSSGQLVIRSCGVHLFDDVDVPAREAGQLIRVDVQEGNMVAAGQLLALIDDRLARRQVDESTFRHQIADNKANDSVQIDSSRRLVDFVTEQFESTSKLYSNGSKSRAEFLEARTNLELKRLDLNKAVNEQKIAAVEAQAEMVKLQAARDSIERHTMVSPFDGVIFEVFKQRGEWVAAGEKVLRVARMDKLKVKGFVNALGHNPADISRRRVTIHATLANSEQVEFPGVIVFVALERVGNSDSFEIWAEVENRQRDNFWQLVPGSVVNMTVLLDQPQVPPEATPPGPAANPGAGTNQPTSLLPQPGPR